MVVSTRWTGARWAVVIMAVGALILVPFAVVGASMEGWAADLVQSLRQHRVLMGLAVASLLAVDVVLPVPSSVVSVAAGAVLGFVPGALASLLGMTVGALFGYWLGRTGGRAAARVVVGDEQLRRLAAGAQQHGSWVIVMTRAVPVLAEASAIFAGLSAMPVRRFATVVVLASAGVSAAYAAVGAFAVEAGSFLLAFTGAILIPLLAWLAWRGTGRTPRSKSEPDSRT